MTESLVAVSRSQIPVVRAAGSIIGKGSKAGLIFIPILKELGDVLGFSRETEFIEYIYRERYRFILRNQFNS